MPYLDIIGFLHIYTKGIFSPSQRVSRQKKKPSCMPPPPPPPDRRPPQSAPQPTPRPPSPAVTVCAAAAAGCHHRYTLCHRRTRLIQLRKEPPDMPTLPRTPPLPPPPPPPPPPLPPPSSWLSPLPKNTPITPFHSDARIYGEQRHAVMMAGFAWADGNTIGNDVGTL